MTTPTAPSASVTPLTDAEIDYAIGRRIMKWGVSAAHGQPAWDVPVNENRGYVFYQSEWRPSTNIADAWRVLGKFQSTHNIYLVTIEKHRWCCDLEGANEHVSEMADTAPRAISLAALAATKARGGE